MQVCYFNLPEVDSAFSINEDNSISKRGLLLAEGEWIDSKKRKHVFSRSRIKTIARNTNANFESGVRIPVLKDHVKTQDSAIGDLNGVVTTRVIESEDLPMGKHRDLIGRLGIFAQDVKIKCVDSIKKIEQNLISTISPGIDIVSNCIREISVTPTPAIPGMALFSLVGSKPILTWEDTLDRTSEINKIKEMFENLSDTFFEIVLNINTATEEDLNGKDPIQLQEQALAEYVERVVELLGLDEFEYDTEEEPPRPVGFSLHDTAMARGIDLANFYYG
jgi:hypothetical protein